MQSSKDEILLVIPHNPDVPETKITMLQHPALYRKLDVLKEAFNYIVVITADTSSYFLKRKTITNYGIPCNSSLRYTIIFMFVVFQFLIRWRRKITVLCFDTSIRALLVVFAAKLFKAPLVSFLVCAPASVYGYVPKLRVIYRFLLMFSELSITHNPLLAERLRKIYPRRDFLILPNYVDKEFADLNYEKESGSIIHVGRLVPEKRITFLLRAFKRVTELNRNTHFYIIGDGPNAAHLRQETRRLQLNNFVSFLGHLNKTRLIERLNKSEVFVFGSNTESFPNAVLEAMACGLPIVVPDVADLKWLVNGGGISADAKNEDAYAEAILRILNSPKLKKSLSDSAKIRVQNLKKLLDKNLPKILYHLKSLNH
jgi:glycosyltransferase involved in cell wall biosynthesis